MACHIFHNFLFKKMLSTASIFWRACKRPLKWNVAVYSSCEHILMPAERKWLCPISNAKNCIAPAKNQSCSARILSKEFNPCVHPKQSNLQPFKVSFLQLFKIYKKMVKVWCLRKKNHVFTGIWTGVTIMFDQRITTVAKMHMCLGRDLYRYFCHAWQAHYLQRIWSCIESGSIKT